MFYSVNSGLYCWDGETGLLIDGIYDGRTHGLSAMPDSLSDQLSRSQGLFAHIDALLFTHQHPDHFHRARLSQLMSTPKPPLLCGPDLVQSSQAGSTSGSGVWSGQINRVHVEARKTVHDGKSFCTIPHCSYLIEMDHRVLFFAGDAALTQEDAEAFSRTYDKIDMAFLNVYQLLALSGPLILEQLRPSRIFLIHLPFVQDDRYHYWAFARQCIKKYTNYTPKIEIPSHMSWIDGKVPLWSTADGYGEQAKNVGEPTIKSS